MKARPILFSGPMIRALLDGRKTQTRRVMKWNSKSVFASYSSMPPQCLAACPYGKTGDLLVVKESAWMWCERRANGKTKTGRPKWRYVPLDGAPIHYQADHREKPLVSITHPETGNQWGWRLKLGRFLPRKASRLTLELSEVRVERLLDISEADAIAEGVSEAAFRSGLTGGKYVPTDRPLHAMWCRKCQGQGVHGALGPNLGYTEVDCSECDSAERLYRNLWEHINGPGSWDANPWVWCLSFRVHQQNVDAFLAAKEAA